VAFCPLCNYFIGADLTNYQLRDGRKLLKESILFGRIDFGGLTSKFAEQKRKK
jgi:hypothetical protein